MSSTRSLQQLSDDIFSINKISNMNCLFSGALRLKTKNDSYLLFAGLVRQRCMNKVRISVEDRITIFFYVSLTSDKLVYSILLH